MRYKISTDQNIAQLDYDKIRYPIFLRKWMQGDHFFPLGMQQKKKLSDFFIDNKFSIDQKEDAWVLCSGEDIIWIAGHRIDDRYKITSSSKNVLIIKLQSDHT